GISAGAVPVDATDAFLAHVEGVNQFPTGHPANLVHVDRVGPAREPVVVHLDEDAVVALNRISHYIGVVWRTDKAQPSEYRSRACLMDESVRYDRRPQSQLTD